MLDKLEEAGFGREALNTLRKLIVNAEKSDLFDVLEYVSFAAKPITREKRVINARSNILAFLNHEQKEFVEFVLDKYIESGVEELAEEKLSPLLKLKYKALEDAQQVLGDVQQIRTVFIDFQKYLYGYKSA